MLTIVSSQNKLMFREQLREMFHLRYRVFVERWGWDLPTADRKNRIDVDQFDQPYTIYLLHLNDETGRVQAACRFNPTTEPHLLSEVFQACCAVRGVPRGPDIMECSRTVIDEITLSRRDYARVTREISYGIAALCHKLGIPKISWLSHMGAYEFCIRMWPSSPLGLPVAFPDGRYAAALSDMNDVALAQSAAPLKGKLPRLSIPLAADPDPSHLVRHWADAGLPAPADDDALPKVARRAA